MHRAGGSARWRGYAAASLATLFVTSPAVGNDFRYQLPAQIVEFASGSPSQRALEDLWDSNINTFTLQGKLTNPWTQSNNTGFENYLDPKIWSYPTLQDFVDQTVVQPITWSAFPNRVVWYFNTSQENPYQIPRDLLYPLIDQGRLYRSNAKGPVANAFQQWLTLKNDAEQPTLRQFLVNLAASPHDFFGEDLSAFTQVSVPTKIYPTVNWKQTQGDWTPFGPTGPRGWKDEYNEWVVTRDASGRITKISFTAENPEYWFTLWHVDPHKVLELYQELVSPAVALDDLILKDKDGRTIFDITGNPAYNPLNKWNYGNNATEHYGGAAHLTSPPNTVGAEITLAANGTMVRTLMSIKYSPNDNIHVSQYGQAFRNSDPNIGFQVNQVVRNLKVPMTLTNPVSLYMQRPNFANYAVTDVVRGYSPEDFFTIVRGRSSEQTGRNYDEILHATMQVPPELAAQGITLTDALTIDGTPVWWGSQVAETFNQALAGTAFLSPERLVSTEGTQGFHVDKEEYLPVKDRSSNTNPAPVPLVANASYERLAQTANFVTDTSCLESRGAALNNCIDVSSATIPVLPTMVRSGTKLLDVALSTSGARPGVKIEVTKNGVTSDDVVIVQKGHYDNSSVIPGQHNVTKQIVYVVDIHIGDNATPGSYGLRLTNPGVEPQAPLPAALIVTR